MRVFCYHTTKNTPSDSTKSLSNPSNGEQVLRAMCWVFPSLNAHNGIHYHVDESQAKTGCTEQY